MLRLADAREIFAGMELSPTSSHVPKRKSTARSAITNGSRVLMKADARTLLGRRFIDLYEQIVADLGG